MFRVSKYIVYKIKTFPDGMIKQKTVSPGKQSFIFAFLKSIQLFLFQRLIKRGLRSCVFNNERKAKTIGRSAGFFFHSKLNINSVVLMKTKKRTICDKEISGQLRVRSRKQTVHKQYTKNNCFLPSKRLSKKQSYWTGKSYKRKSFIFLNLMSLLWSIFVGDSSYIEHMNKFHGLPV